MPRTADLVSPAEMRATKRLAKWRRDGLSMDRVGKLTGMHTSTIGNILKGRSVMGAKAIAAILAAKE